MRAGCRRGRASAPGGPRPSVLGQHRMACAIARQVSRHDRRDQSSPQARSAPDVRFDRAPGCRGRSARLPTAPPPPAGTRPPHPAHRRESRSSAPAARRGGSRIGALQVGGAARRVVGGETRPLVELDEARAREPLRRGGKQSVDAGRRLPAREADQEIGLRASRLPDERRRLSIQRLPIREDVETHGLSPRRLARGPRAWPRRW